MAKIYVGIIGSRRRDEWKDFSVTHRKCIEIFEMIECEGNEVVIVSGGCPKGGDRFAEILANGLDIPIIIHYPDKTKLPVNPKSRDFKDINFARNTLIARDSDILVAVVAEDRKGGTEHTIKEFQRIHEGEREVILV